MEKQLPMRFFIVTFLWSWLLWLPFVLVGVAISEMNNDLRPYLTIAAIIIGAFGPAIGAIYSIKTIQGNLAVRTFLRSFLSIDFG